MTHLFSHRIEVRFRDCDPLGHVNNAVYLTYLEQARLFYWRSMWGFGGAAAAALPGVIMARAEIDYKRPAKVRRRCSTSGSRFAACRPHLVPLRLRHRRRERGDSRLGQDGAGDVRLRGRHAGTDSRRNPGKNDE